MTATDPRKENVESGLGIILHGLLVTMKAYSDGPVSTPQIEAELGRRLVEASRVLQRYGRHVQRGNVGNVASHAGRPE
jgi:hypothetical protein